MDFNSLFWGSLKESLNIILIIFGLMILVEILVLKYKESIIKFIKNKSFLGYIVASLFGIIPGCVGTFAMDSLYMSGLLGFGGITATMIATSGDEAFLMISMAATGKIPVHVIIILTAILFILGIIGGVIGDIFAKKSRMKFCEKCSIDYHKGEEFKFKHFIKEHIYNHIIKKHIWKIFLWVFAAIFAINILHGYVGSNLAISGVTKIYLLIIASVIAILPISGPNIFLAVMFANGMVPFSVLLANSIIQDGHGLLPLLGFSVSDALKIKIFNFVFGFLIGLALLTVGL